VASIVGLGVVASIAAGLVYENVVLASGEASPSSSCMRLWVWGGAAARLPSEAGSSTVVRGRASPPGRRPGLLQRHGRGAAEGPACEGRPHAAGPPASCDPCRPPRRPRAGRFISDRGTKNLNLLDALNDPRFLFHSAAPLLSVAGLDMAQVRPRPCARARV
jgi:hypothetical protein